MNVATETPLLSVAWRPREVPLAAVGVAACGPAAAALGRRLLARSDTELGEFQGACGPGFLLILGAEPDLPWSDGAVYLGRDSAAPNLLLPTALEPSVPVALLERMLLSRFSQVDSPVVVAPQLDLLASAASARPIYRPALAAWLAAA